MEWNWKMLVFTPKHCKIHESSELDVTNDAICCCAQHTWQLRHVSLQWGAEYFTDRHITNAITDHSPGCTEPFTGLHRALHRPSRNQCSNGPLTGLHRALHRPSRNQCSNGTLTGLHRTLHRPSRNQCSNGTLTGLHRALHRPSCNQCSNGTLTGLHGETPEHQQDASYAVNLELYTLRQCCTHTTGKLTTLQHKQIVLIMKSYSRYNTNTNTKQHREYNWKKQAYQPY